MNYEMKARNLLAVPDAFRQTALAFPDKVSQALALIDNPKAAKELLDKADMLSHYARRVKADTEITNAIGYGKTKIVAKLGHLMPATPAKDTGRGKKKSVPPAGQICPKQTASRYRKVAAHDAKIDDYYAKCQAGDEELTLGGFIRFATGTEKAGRAAHVSANSGVPEWYTPAVYIQAARDVMGGIDLDPASSDIAQRTVKARIFYTIDADGLAQKWSGRVWLNPPYSADLVKRFIGKLGEHFSAGDVTQAIVLVNNATETQWFQSAASLCSAICFPSGRVKFLDEDGKPGAPLQGQAVLYFGDGAVSFASSFSPFGFCMEHRR